MAKLPGDFYTEEIRARFWLMGANGGYVGVGRVTLLESIEKTGSINKAAKEMGMSYKKAWRLIDEMNSMYEEPLVIKEQGGVKGGGSSLTEKGKAVLMRFYEVEGKLKSFLENA